MATVAADSLGKKLGDRRLIRFLIVNRVAKNMTRRQVANEMGVPLSQVCTLEAKFDGDLTIAEIFRYADAIGLGRGAIRAWISRFPD